MVLAVFVLGVWTAEAQPSPGGGGGGGGSVTNLPSTSNVLKGNGTGGASDTGIASGALVTNQQPLTIAGGVIASNNVNGAVFLNKSSSFPGIDTFAPGTDTDMQFFGQRGMAIPGLEIAAEFLLLTSLAIAGNSGSMAETTNPVRFPSLQSGKWPTWLS